MKNSKNIFLDKSKTSFYIKNRIRNNFISLEKSKKQIFKKIKIKNHHILDIGCATGDIFSALKEKFQINYTGIDIDKKCIVYAKKKFGNKAKFIACDIFDKKLKKNSFDIVMIWNLFYMLPNWKKILIRACDLSKKYVMFENKVRYNGTTIIDRDLSYQYYHLSSKRNYYIIHNIYELISFFQTHELNLEHVYGYGYKLPLGKTTAKLPLKESDVFVGSFLLKKSKKKIVRTGVQPKTTSKPWVKFDLNFPGFKK